MSYDLMVFHPDAPPEDRDGFLKWYDAQTKWDEGHDYQSLDVAAPNLQAWLLDILQHYPAMNGPLSNPDADVDDPCLSEYSIGKSIIYCCFAWSQAERAHNVVFSLAEKHQVGFFDVSATDGQVRMPDGDGEYSCMHGGNVA